MSCPSPTRAAHCSAARRTPCGAMTHSAARGACRQPCDGRMRPHRCGLPVAVGCRPAASGGRLRVTGSSLVASQVAAARAAARRVWPMAREPAAAPVATSRRSSTRRVKDATTRRVDAWRRVAATVARQLRVWRPLARRRNAPWPRAYRRQRAARVGRRARAACPRVACVRAAAHLGDRCGPT